MAGCCGFASNFIQMKPKPELTPTHNIHMKPKPITYTQVNGINDFSHQDTFVRARPIKT